MNKKTKVKVDKFLEDLSKLSEKHGIRLETTDIMFLTDDKGSIGDIGIRYDYGTNKYIQGKC